MSETSKVQYIYKQICTGIKDYMSGLSKAQHPVHGLWIGSQPSPGSLKCRLSGPIPDTEAEPAFIKIP